jgi:hypothetical protein
MTPSVKPIFVKDLHRTRRLYIPHVWVKFASTMVGENWRSVTDEPVEFEK